MRMQSKQSLRMSAVLRKFEWQAEADGPLGLHLLTQPQAGLTWMKDGQMITAANNALRSRTGGNTNQQQQCQRTNTLDDATGQSGRTGKPVVWVGEPIPVATAGHDLTKPRALDWRGVHLEWWSMTPHHNDLQKELRLDDDDDALELERQIADGRC